MDLLKISGTGNGTGYGNGNGYGDGNGTGNGTGYGQEPDGDQMLLLACRGIIYEEI